MTADVRVSRDVAYGEAGGRALILDVYDPGSPSGGASRPAMLIIHGGGWEGGDKASEDCERDAEFFANLGLLALSVNYRLSGEAPAPAATERTQKRMSMSTEALRQRLASLRPE